MHFLRHSEIPIVRGGLTQTDRHAQNVDYAWWNDRLLVFWKVYKSLSGGAEANAPEFRLGYIDPDGLQDSSTPQARTAFDGYNLTRHGSTDATVFKWADDVATDGSEAPSDVYSNTSITGGRIGDIAVETFTLGGVTKIYRYENVYDYNGDGTNRLALWTSTDGGTTWSFVQEIASPSTGSTPFGGTVGGLIQLTPDGPVYCFVGAEAKLAKSTDGISWSYLNNGDPVVFKSSDPVSMRHSGMPVGRAFVHGDYVYLLKPASRISDDHPEGILLFRRKTSDIETVGTFEEYPGNPIAVRGPVNTGIWQLNPFFAGGVLYALSNDWGMVGYNNVGSSTMNAMREEPYYSSDVDGFKSVYINRNVNFNAVDDWSAFPIVDGGVYKLARNDQYIIPAATPAWGVPLAFTSDPGHTEINWLFKKRGECWSIHPNTKTTLSLAVNGSEGIGEVGAAFSPSTTPLTTNKWYLIETIGTSDFTAAGAEANVVGGIFKASTNYSTGTGTVFELDMSQGLGRALGTPIDLRTHDDTIETRNLDHHWIVAPVGGKDTTKIALINRWSSLALGRNLLQTPILYGTFDTWEIVPYV